MEQSNTENVSLLDRPDQLQPRVTTREYETLPPPITSAWADHIADFCIGMVSGAAGGLLLGATAVAVVQSLVLLDDNKTLMDQLENYTGKNCNMSIFQRQVEEAFFWIINCEKTSVHISLFALLFGLFSSASSVPVGYFVGLSTYALVIKKDGGAARAKALTLAGSVCVMVITATGYCIGLALEPFLLMTVNVNVLIWSLISVVCVLLLPISTLIKSGSSMVQTLLLAPGIALCAFRLSLFFKSRSCLLLTFLSPQLFLNELRKSHLPRQVCATVPLMLIISDVFNYAGQPIVTLRSSNTTDTGSTVAEDIFVGILASQLLVVSVGMSMYLSWQNGGAGKICAGALACGTAVLKVLIFALPAVGAGPTLGGLMGVAGAVGVSLSAAGTTADHYRADNYGLVGKIGLSVGAGVGAFLASYAHDGLSGLFMGVCAAIVPAALYLEQLWPFTITVFFFITKYFNECPMNG